MHIDFKVFTEKRDDPITGNKNKYEEVVCEAFIETKDGTFRACSKQILHPSNIPDIEYVKKITFMNLMSYVIGKYGIKKIKTIDIN